jgi:hypothetical protein
MKKKIIYGAAMFAIAALAAINVNVNNRDNGLSDVALANIEALGSEIGDACGGCSTITRSDNLLLHIHSLYEYEENI